MKLFGKPVGVWIAGLDGVTAVIAKSSLDETAALMTICTTLGTAGGWVFGLIVQGMGKSKPTLGRAIAWGTGAGAFFGVMLCLMAVRY